MSDDVTLDELRTEAKRRFGIDIRMRPQLEPPHYCPQARAAQCFFARSVLSIDQLGEFPRWAVTSGWQVSAQHFKPLTADTQLIKIVYLAPVKRFQHSILYHATRTASVPSILTDGLTPGTRPRQNTNRADTIGNIYAVAKLGTPSDAGVRGSNSAHWWRDHLANVNRHSDSNWCILKIDAKSLTDAILFGDMWSESGIIIGHVESIAPSYISKVYPLSG